MRHIRNTTLKKSTRIKIMQTVLKPVSHLSLPLMYLLPLIFNGLLPALTLLHHCFTHSKFWILYIHHQSSVPVKPQDDVRLDPALPYRPASCYFGSSGSVPQNATYEHRHSVGQSIQSAGTGWICQSLSSSRSSTDLLLSLSFLPFTSHLKTAEAEST